jgi:hypothetical protein
LCVCESHFLTGELFFSLFIYPYVHTLFGPFLPPKVQYIIGKISRQNPHWTMSRHLSNERQECKEIVWERERNEEGKGGWMWLTYFYMCMNMEHWNLLKLFKKEKGVGGRIMEGMNQTENNMCMYGNVRTKPPT